MRLSPFFSLLILFLTPLYAETSLPEVVGTHGASAQLSRGASNPNPDQFISPPVDQFFLPDGVGGEGSDFGKAVSIDGLTMLVSAPQATRQGVVYVYDKVGANWVQGQVLEPPVEFGFSAFGKNVHLHGDWAFITTSRTVSCGQGNTSLCTGQDVQVYRRVGTQWQWQESWLDGNDFSHFGDLIKSDGNLLLVGEPALEDNQGNGFILGALHVYEYDGSQWQKTQKLMPQVANRPVHFASNFAIDPVTHRIAIRQWSSLQNQEVTVFFNTGGSWQASDSVSAFVSDDAATFGHQILFLGDSLLVSAPALVPAGPSQPGAFYLFSPGVRNWSAVQRLTPPVNQTLESFGVTVQKSGTEVLVAAVDPTDLTAVPVFHYALSGNALQYLQQSTILSSTNYAPMALKVFTSSEAGLVDQQDTDADDATENTLVLFDWDGANWQTEALVVPQNTSDNDYLGYVMATDGDWLFMAEKSDNPAANAGKVRVYRKTGGQWNRVDTLQPAAVQGGDWFGGAMDIDGARAVIGAPGEAGAGAVHVYELLNNNWTETDQVTAANAQAGDGFGRSVALAGDELLVGAPGTINGGINGHGGAVYQFQFNDTQWNQIDRLDPPQPGVSEAFGNAIYLDGNRLLACDPADSEREVFSGAAHVFEKNNGQWQHTAKIVPDSPVFAGLFCQPAALHGDTLAIAQPKFNGGVSLYRLTGGQWTRLHHWREGSNFGRGLAFDVDGRLLIGKPDGSSSVGYFGDGSVLVYESFLDGWVQSGRLEPDTSRDALLFGYSLAWSGDDVFVSAPVSNERGYQAGLVSHYLWNRPPGLLGGRISGLLKGNQVQIDSAGIGPYLATENGVYAYRRYIPQPTSYDFTVTVQPSSPIQPCHIENPAGILWNADVSNLNIVCELGTDLIFRHGLDNDTANQ